VHADGAPSGPRLAPIPSRCAGVDGKRSPQSGRAAGEPLATVVRIYQLKGASKIGGAAFEEILDLDKTPRRRAGLLREVTLNPPIGSIRP